MPLKYLRFLQVLAKIGGTWYIYLMHERARHILTIFKKRSRIFPVLGLLGARQVGKSTFLRDQWAKVVKANYVTFDRKDARDRATRATEHFLRVETEEFEKNLIVDEAQKVPDIFDAVKVVVDENRKRGLFTLSGSSEFSARSSIRESLTGRIGASRLYPMTIKELSNQPFGALFSAALNRKKISSSYCRSQEIETWVERGGMPALSKLRDQGERFTAIEEWIDTTCNRDLHRLKGAKFSGELAKDILYAAVRIESPTASSIARALRTDARKVKNHLEGLKALFVVNQCDPHSVGVGKPVYFIFDSGIANFLGGSRLYRLKLWVLNECLSQYEYAGGSRPRIYYYRSSKDSSVDFVIDDRVNQFGVIVLEEETPGPYTLRGAKAFLAKMPKHSSLSFLCPCQTSYQEDKNISVVPWTHIA